MPFWLQILWGVTSPVVVILLGYAARSYQKIATTHDFQIQAVCKDIDDLKAHCRERALLTLRTEEAIQKVLRNQVRLGIASGVEDLEK